MKEKIKKIVLGAIAVFIIGGFGFLFQYGIANATSGTCSWHGGINCAAGADWDGSAICNDGWKDSSEGFFSTAECTDNFHCSSSQLESLQQKYGVPATWAEIQSKMQEVSSLNSQLDVIIAKLNIFPITGRISAEERQLMIEHDSLIRQINTLLFNVSQQRSLLSDMNSVIDSECWAFGYDNEQQRMLDRIKIMEGLQAQSCSANSYYSNGQCTCNEGYVANGSVCITYSQSCQLKYGQNSYGDKQLCYCSAGYEFNAAKTACVKPEAPKNQEAPPIKAEQQQQEEQPNQQIQQIQPEGKEEVVELKQGKSEEVKAENKNQENKSEQQKKGILASISRFSANVYNAFKNIFSRILRWF